MTDAELKLDELALLAATALELPADRVRGSMDRSTFTGLGGSSLQAVRLTAAIRQRGLAIPLSGLLGGDTLAAVLRLAEPASELAPGAGPALHAGPPHAVLPNTVLPNAVLPLLPGQQGVLQADEFAPGPAYHLIFTAQVSGVTASAVPAALDRLTRRHEGLRTVFLPADPSTGKYGRRVLGSWQPDVRRQVIRPAHGGLTEAQLNAQLGAASTGLLLPFERPGVCFVITEAEFADQEPLLFLSVLAHHALLDGWAMGLLFTELAALLADAEPSQALADLAPSPELVLALDKYERDRPEWGERLRRQVGRLDGVPLTLELPTDLRRPQSQEMTGQRLESTLSRAAALAWRRLEQAAGCTRTVVLLAAFALVVSRRAGRDDLVIGVPVAWRDQPALQEVLALCSRIVPVRCRIRDQVSVQEYLNGIAGALADALDGAAIPFAELVTALRPEHDRRRNPIVQFVLGAHDDLIPELIRRDGVELRITEGHCGGAPLDVTLYLQRGGAAPKLALEHAASVLTPPEAADLLDGVDAALIELADGLTWPLARARTVSAAQQRRLESVASGPALPPNADATDIWSMVLAAAAANPDALAVRSGPVRLSYARLVALARSQAAQLVAAGVGDGDPVLIAVPRGPAEPIAILAVLALGAHYVSIHPDVPDSLLREMLNLVTVSAALVSADAASADLAKRARATATKPFPLIPIIEPGADLPMEAAPSSVLPAIRPADDRVAYVAFTSGSTGVPKAVRIPHRAVARLVLPGPQACLQAGPGERMLRLAPLAFDISTLELFAPLTAGGCVVPYPPGPVDPPDLARFLADNKVTVLWLTAGLFRLTVDFAPHGFAGVRHVLTGGDVVPPEQVRALLARHPGLRVSNGYGPTENTTFSTVADFDDVAQVRDPLPIGRAVRGSGVLVLDESGGLVPPGGVGELYVTGLGLALDYARAPERTAEAFVALPGTGERAYRSGDLVRLDSDDQLRFLGRRDNQVKIRGFRVELDEVRHFVRSQPGVRDAVVFAAGPDASAKKLIGVLLPEPGAAPAVSAVAASVASALPGYAVPALWAVVSELPTTANGKVDTARLAELARPPGELAAEPADRPVTTVAGQPATGPPNAGQPASGLPDADHAEAIADAAWAVVLGRPPSGADSDFFRSGGDSLALARLIALLAADYAVQIAPRDLYVRPTPRHLANLIRPLLATTGPANPGLAAGEAPGPAATMAGGQ